MLKNLLLSIEDSSANDVRKILVKGDHTQSKSALLQHAREQLKTYFSLGDLEDDELLNEATWLNQEEVESKKTEVYLTLQVNHRTEERFSTGYYGEDWSCNYTPANGPVGYSEKKDN